MLPICWVIVSMTTGGSFGFVVEAIMAVYGESEREEEVNSEGSVEFELRGIKVSSD